MRVVSDNVAAALRAADLGRESFAETLGVSDEERAAELSRVRKAAGKEPDAAERVSIRFGKVVAAFKEAEGRSPGVDDGEVWQALTRIVREEVEGA